MRPAQHPLRAWFLEQVQGLNRKIVIALVGSLLLSLWCFVGFWSWWERSSILATNARVLQQLTIAVHEQTRGLFRQAETALAVASHWMAENPGKDPGTAAGFITLIDRLRQTSDSVIDIRLVSRDGILRYVPDYGQARQTDVSDRDYFRAQADLSTRGLYVGRPVVSRVTGKWGIPISLPVTRAGGEVAVVFAAIELDRIAASFEAERIKPLGTIVIVREDGTLMFRSPLDEQTISTTIAQDPDWTQHLAALAEDPHHIAPGQIDGRTHIVSSQRVEDYPLRVAVTADMDDLLAGWQRTTGVLLLVATALTAAILLLGIRLLRSMQLEAAARRELEQRMLTDPLTGTGNRRMLELRLAEEIQRARRYQRTLTAVFLDLDHFKQVNDRHGHGVGDAVLVRVAESLNARLRHSDHLARFGGEEFVLLLTETGLDAALALVERMRTAVAELRIPELLPGHITLSAGLAQWQPGESAEALLHRADQALYRAKAAGRNRAHVDRPA